MEYFSDDEKKFGIWHGDVIIHKIDNLPPWMNSTDISRIDEIVLAEGEVTGHRHIIKDAENAEFFKQRNAPNQAAFLKIKKDVPITHEEHRPIVINPGNYRVETVREFDPWTETTKRVAD